MQSYRLKVTDFLEYSHGAVEHLPALTNHAVLNQMYIRQLEECVLDLQILQMHYCAPMQLELTEQVQTPLLELHFNLSAHPIKYVNDFMFQEVVPPHSGNLIFVYPNDSHSEIVFCENAAYHTFDIHLPLHVLAHHGGICAALDAFLEGVHRQESRGLFKDPIAVTPQILGVIHQLKTCVYSGIVRKMYMESKVLELLAYCMDQHPVERETTLVTQERQLIEEAAYLIETNLSAPMTIAALSRAIGMNQTKLKTAFKAKYKTTLFGYLQQLRMERAQSMLLDSNCSISELSHLLGYSSVSNFSLAFKNIFGYPPSKLRL